MSHFKHRTFPRIVLRSPTVDENLELVKAVSADGGAVFRSVPASAPVGETNSAEFWNDIGHTNSQDYLSPALFSVSSSSSLASDEQSPVRTPVAHQRSISMVNQPSSNLVPRERNNEDSSNRPRGMSLPHNSAEGPKQRRRGMSFLHSSEGFSSLVSQLHHLPVPTLTISSPGGDMGGRKFSFGLRRLSQTTLNRSDSMISLSFRSLISYITDDNLSGLRSYLDNKRNQVDDRDENNTTALIVAATQGKLQFVRELIRCGADVNAEDGDNWTALLCASKEGHPDVCRELLDHGAVVDHRDMATWTPLLWAAYKGRTTVAQYLIEKQADVNVHENYHISPLHWACGRGHVEIARMLIARGAKVNVGDKYGTTPLIWASRKGSAEIVEMLLKSGAHVDASGMVCKAGHSRELQTDSRQAKLRVQFHLTLAAFRGVITTMLNQSLQIFQIVQCDDMEENSWTPLLVATSGNHADVVNLLLEHKPNVNALDKDGYTALAIACKEGFNEIAQALLLVPGIYVNLQDRSGDTNLIHAVKGGHRGIVEALLKKYVDIDTPGKDRKTAMYTAVEKGNTAVVKLLLSANPDLEVTTKDGDTALLRAVRIRNAEIVQLCLDKKSKVSATDKKGDTALHIAMRARSKAIVEILLRNPKNSQLLYRPNRSGETPYNIDINHQKTIIGQIFGRLNTNEENESLLGYDLYSSALADILSEPSLSMPITVGLYAKWGSGKSFLLTKLREEMKNFARQWVDPAFHISSLLFATIVHIAVAMGVALGVVTNWISGVVLAASVVFLTLTFLILLWSCSKRYDWNWPYQASVNLAKYMNSFRLVLQVMFCCPPGAQYGGDSLAQPIRFFFTDQTRISNTTGGEHYVVQMLGSLYDSIEVACGSFSTRLYRAFRPTPQKASSCWKWRKACCLPYIVIFESWLVLFFVGMILVTSYFDESSEIWMLFTEESLKILLIVVAFLLLVSILANIYTISHVATALVFSQRRHLQRTVARLDVLKSEGFLLALKNEVSLMTNMVKCLDGFTEQQSRLVVVVDGLDSCEQDKVLMVLDAIHMLSDVNSPFVIILAIDPHIIAKAVELNSRRLITESNINGHEYLRNMVHLPFYLANSALRRVKVAQSTSRRSTLAANEQNEEPTLQMSARRLSVESNFTASAEKLKMSRKGSRKLKISESIASSIGSNLNKICGAQDLTKMLLTDDYFSDVNPRSMRRLLNVIYVTGRLLKAFQMDFNWYHLALWVNITEQWPYRSSWLILYYEMNEERLEDQTSLKHIYDEVRPRIPVNKEVEPLLEIDRDEKKFDVFLTYHRTTLMLSDLKVFLPFTINLDPFFKKIIKEDMQEDYYNGGQGLMMRSIPARPPTSNKIETAIERRARRHHSQPPPVPTQPAMMWTNQGWYQMAPPMVPTQPPLQPFAYQQPISATTSIPGDLLSMKLSTRAVDDVCDLITKTSEITADAAAKYTALIRSNNINGKVLLHCDLRELKEVLQMAFGDWELFKLLVASLREHELTTVTQAEEVANRNVRFLERKRTLSEKKKKSDADKERKGSTKHSTMENQITLEDEMICGALTTLNEEACEDALEGTEGDQAADAKDTAVVYLQSSPLSQTTWQVADDSSAPSSVNATPILQRKQSSRRNSRSRPNSLLIEGLSPPASPKFPIFGDSFLLKANLKNESPAVVVTPATSVEKLHRLKDKFLRATGGDSMVSTAGNSISDDEVTPLVIEYQHEVHSSDSSQGSGCQKSSEIHHDSDSGASALSVNNILDRSKSCDSIASSRSQKMTREVCSLSDMSMHVRTRHVGSPGLVRQHEFQQESSLAVEWDGPETSV